jgi:signal transduction histidine kinase/ligand-binding sensor domain-containing protein
MICRSALFLILVCGGTDLSASNYFTHVWQAGTGLPQNAVTTIVQTRDGYLWLGTYSGLARFDGVRFVVFDNRNTPEMHSSRVTSLFEDATGELWIGYETGELTRYRNGAFHSVETIPNWNGRRIMAITADDHGDIWAFGADGMVARLRDGMILAPGAGNALDVSTLARDRRGTIWILRDGRVSLLKDGRLTPMQFDSESADGYVQGICASSDGGMWIAGNGRVRKWRDGRWHEDLGTIPWGEGQALAFMETQAGDLAIGVVDKGLILMLPSGVVSYFNRNNGLPSDWIRTLCEDSEGNLWMGTGSGLAVLRAGKVATINPPDHWQNRAVLSISLGRNGSMWFGTEGAGVYQLNRDEWTRYGTEQGMSNLFVWSTAEDAQGKIWAGTWGGGMFVQQGDHFERLRGLEDVRDPIPAQLQLPDGGAWLGTSAGLIHYRDGKAESYGIEAGVQFPVRAVVRDRDGAIWFGMLGGGIGCLKSSRVTQFSKTNGLSSDFVACLRFDDDGALWIGTFGGGLNRLKHGRFAVISTSQGLPNNTICDIEDDGRGNLWFSSFGGIFCVSKKELNSCADGSRVLTNCLTYGIGDGLPTLEGSGGSQPSGCRTPDGRIWFPTSKGVVVVNPNEIKVNRLPPPVVIEELVVDGHPVAKNPAGGPLRIPAGQNRFEFHYTGLSFVVPEKVRFKYRLEGLETDWVDGETKRQVPYNYIPPGDYTFHVIACNNDDIWNETGAALSFTLLPHFWQTWWFRALTGALAVAAASSVVWFDMRRRMQRKLERLERQRAIERERERIARDIHDDLGASLTRITMLSQSAQGNLDDPAQAAANLDRIYGTARELTRAMDEIVWAVNPKHDTLDSLASYLGKYAQDFLGAAKVRCRLDLPVQLPAWHLTAEIRHNLFLAFKEALNNVVRHAAASEVRVALVLQPTGFVLSVEDNGCGFATEPPGDSPTPDPDRYLLGNGLANMRLRLAEIGGQCEIQSTFGQGTRFTVVVPASQLQRNGRGSVTVS